MEYNEKVTRKTVVRVTTEFVPACEYCGMDAEYMDEYHHDFAWCEDCEWEVRDMLIDLIREDALSRENQTKQSYEEE